MKLTWLWRRSKLNINLFNSRIKHFTQYFIFYSTRTLDMVPRLQEEYCQLKTNKICCPSVSIFCTSSDFFFFRRFCIPAIFLNMEWFWKSLISIWYYKLVLPIEHQIIWEVFPLLIIRLFTVWIYIILLFDTYIDLSVVPFINNFTLQCI